MRMAMEMADYEGLRREQAEKRARGELMGIGISFFTETVGAGPRKDMDIAGLGMDDGAELRVHPTGKAVLSISVQTQGQGHETTFAQIVAEELGIPPEDVEVVHGDTDLTPFGLGTYGSRSTPVSGAATAITSRKVRDKARLIAAAMLEASPADLEWEKGRWFVKGDRPTAARRSRRSRSARTPLSTCRTSVEGDLEAVITYNPTNLTYPVRRLHLRRRHRSRHRARQGAPVHRRRRLRHPHQPDDHRGPDPRRAGGGHRHRADGVHRASTRMATASTARSWTT